MKPKRVLFITQAAMIAALYMVLTMSVSAFNLANGAVQIRISESLTVLPAFTPAAIPGLFLGCLFSNIATGCLPPDVILGSLATLLGALGTYHLRKFKWAVPIPPIIANALIIPFILAYVYHIPGGVPYFMLTISIGEIISCGVLGMFLYRILSRYRNVIFK